jgi:superfamily I DNA/RNA helicase
MVADLPNEFGGVRDKTTRIRAFEAAWARLQSDEPGWPTDPIDRAFHRELMAWLTFHRAMLIGELVPVTLSYVRNNPTAALRSAFSHVHTDEYQDLNRAEQVLVDVIASEATLVVAGDDDQSIYRFKFAHPEGIIEFMETHPGARSETLDQCRRCPQAVIDVANSLISHNTRSTDRGLIPGNDNPVGEVHVVQWLRLGDEASGIAEYIRRRIVRGDCDPGSVLVLAPRRRLGYRIRDHLRDMQVPVQSYFFEQTLESAVAQERFTLLNLLADPTERVAIRCWLGLGGTTFRVGPYSRMRAIAEEQGSNVVAVIEGVLQGAISIPYSEPLIDRYRQLLQERAGLTEMSGLDFIEAWLPTDMAGVDELREIANRGAAQASSVAELRDFIRDAITQPELPLEADFVRIMSLHKSKGLTADTVVIAGCVEGLIPLIDADLPQGERQQQLEEQRRLFYVAITRPRNVLVISGSSSYPADEAYRMLLPVRQRGRSAQTIASRFVAELGPTAPAAVEGRAWLDGQ